ncbi:hypothetical protein [Nocardioides plantarum]|uniref:Uncharacterized protein n=1 Tax=Nocardioides plantarum TaxID=29299 RepID=A0ABV5K7X9_9ACTN|nr:hypothetical protein [Nocardioides plantarum]
MTPLRSFLLACVTTALLMAAVPAADAQTWRHADAVGDAQVTRYDDDGQLDEPVVDPQERRGDLTNLRVTYTAQTLRMAISVRSQRIAIQDVLIKVVSSRGYTYRMVLEYFIENSLSITRNGYRYECEGLKATRTQAGYVVTAPRSCFDDAYRIRVGVQTDFSTDNAEETGDAGTYDDALRTGRYTKNKPKLSPWIVAG